MARTFYWLSSMNDNKVEWSNWSGDIRFTPAGIAIPASSQDVATLVERAASERLHVRAVGAGHSCAPIVKTDDLLLSLEDLKGLHKCDDMLRRATVGAGTSIAEIGEAIFKAGYGMENTGHINEQAIAGAVSTGTHGAGKHLPNISGQVVGVKLVDGNGILKTYNIEDHPETMRALKVSLGTMGIFTEVTLRALPAFEIERKQYMASVEDCLSYLPLLMEQNRNFCFYWYPRRDDVSIRTWNEPGQGMQQLPFNALLYKQMKGWGKDVIPSQQHLKFNELEYSVDINAAAACFQEVRKRVQERHRKNVAWRILFRPVAKDDVYLSNAYEKDIVAITIHQNASLPYQDYFADIEPILQAFGGRPHWGKKHSMKAAQLRERYPMWQRFQQLRSEFDPQGIFMNDYTKRVFIED